MSPRLEKIKYNYHMIINVENMVEIAKKKKNRLLELRNLARLQDIRRVYQN